MMLKNIRILAALLFAGLLFAMPPPGASAGDYPWLSREPSRDGESALAPPAGFERVPAAADSFAGWLRRLPLAPAGTPVLLHDGRPLLDQSIIAAVVDIDTGMSDLQQCADAVMRLRAEFLYSRGLLGAIGFDLVNSERYPFSAYSRGATPRQAGAEITLASEKPRGAGHNDLRRYLDLLFGFASTRSLARELQPVPSLREAEIGDVFIRAGEPGHALIIADMAVSASGRRLVLLVQGSMPARGIYVLNNTRAPELGAWFEIADGQPLITLGYEFRPDELRRF
ncbi:MAG: DUF4846 domain-containing protein [Dongiaceae bacterium]